MTDRVRSDLAAAIAATLGATKVDITRVIASPQRRARLLFEARRLSKYKLDISYEATFTTPQAASAATERTSGSPQLLAATLAGNLRQTSSFADQPVTAAMASTKGCARSDPHALLCSFALHRTNWCVPSFRVLVCVSSGQLQWQSVHGKQRVHGRWQVPANNGAVLWWVPQAGWHALQRRGPVLVGELQAFGIHGVPEHSVPGLPEHAVARRLGGRRQGRPGFRWVAPPPPSALRPRECMHALILRGRAGGQPATGRCGCHLLRSPRPALHPQ